MNDNNTRNDNNNEWCYESSYWPTTYNSPGDTMTGFLGPIERETLSEGRRQREVDYRLITPSGDAMPYKLAIGAALDSLREVPTGSEIHITWLGKRPTRSGDNEYNHYSYKWRPPVASS